MSNATIYIRKENEDFWNELADKSMQVNHWIQVAKGGESTEPPKATKSKDGWNVIKLPDDEPQEKLGSIDEQLDSMGLVRDPTLPGKAFNPENESYIPYKITNGKVVLA